MFVITIAVIVITIISMIIIIIIISLAQRRAVGARRRAMDAQWARSAAGLRGLREPRAGAEVSRHFKRLFGKKHSKREWGNRVFVVVV